MNNNKIKVAIIGAGMIANEGHIPAWKSASQDAEIVGVFNHNLGKAQNTATRHSIPHSYDDVDLMLNELKPDVTVVCTPNVSHKEYTIKSLMAGTHVLCDKPIAASFGDAVEMYQAAEQTGKVLMVAQPMRYNKANVAAKELIDAGELGDIYYAETAFMRRFGIPTWGRFHMKEHSGGGALLDLGVHILDAILWLVGSPKVSTVSGATFNKLAMEQARSAPGIRGIPKGIADPRAYDPTEFDVDEMAVGFLRCENGITIHLKTSWAANLPDGFGDTVIIGTKGGMKLNPLTIYKYMGNRQVDITPKVGGTSKIPFFDFRYFVKHFIEVIQGKAELSIKKGEVFNVMQVLDGIYQSSEAGKEVQL